MHAKEDSPKRQLMEDKKQMDTPSSPTVVATLSPTGYPITPFPTGQPLTSQPTASFDSSAATDYGLQTTGPPTLPVLSGTAAPSISSGGPQINFLGSEYCDSILCGLCEGDCDEDYQCEGNLKCFQRTAYQSVPGCSGGSFDASGKRLVFVCKQNQPVSACAHSVSHCKSRTIATILATQALWVDRFSRPTAFQTTTITTTLAYSWIPLLPLHPVTFLSTRLLPTASFFSPTDCLVQGLPKRDKPSC